ncbi:MAG TPA: shikimate dehydrogenase, partial [Burkholderiales bacterium]|nr:shikimate dehydrogenase [Burkholderiales bacterium]
MTERYAVIGNPVAHSKSPWIHAEFARACRQDLEYTLIEAPLDGFRAALDAFRAAGGSGMNVTLPFKEEAHACCQRLSERARRARVVNTLSFGARATSGDTTDGVG